MSQTSTQAEPQADEHKHTVTVSLTITNEAGETQTTDKTIDGGPTKVEALKAELGVPPDAALWLIKRDGTKKPLGDHETVNVEEGDHFEALVRGGVS